MIFHTGTLQLLGNGSSILGFFILIFALIGGVNTVMMITFWFDTVIKSFTRDGITNIYFLLAVIVVLILGFIAFGLAIVRTM